MGDSAEQMAMKIVISVIMLIATTSAMPTTSANHTRVLVVGDSWGTVVGAGSAAGLSFFERKLKQHKCPVTSSSIAVPGTMATDWDNGNYLKMLQEGAKTHDYVWIILMGNDALETMPDCAAQKKTAAQCGDELYASMMVHIGNIVDAVHEANPQAKVVGFGYDTMFGGLGCALVTHELFPQCFGLLKKGGNACFNTQFLRIQQVWHDVAANRSWVDEANILGATQAAAGDPKAVLGKSIDMDKMGPAKYWPDYEACFHPGVLGGEDSGAMVVMEAFYKQYWSTELSC